MVRRAWPGAMASAAWPAASRSCCRRTWGRFGWPRTLARRCCAVMYPRALAAPGLGVGSWGMVVLDFLDGTHAFIYHPCYYLLLHKLLIEDRSHDLRRESDDISRLRYPWCGRCRSVRGGVSDARPRGWHVCSAPECR